MAPLWSLTSHIAQVNTNYQLPESGILRLSPLRKPIIDARGFPMCSDYTEYFWLPILGPSATWLVRRFASLVEDVADDVIVNVNALAAALGMSYVPGRVGPFTRSVKRTIMFNFVQPSPVHDETLYVRTVAPPLPTRLINRLPESARISIDKWHQYAQDSQVT
jgi:hypothetical protein